MTALDSFIKLLEGVSPEDEFLVDMNFDGPGVVLFDVAHIATDLVPKADEYLSGGSKVYVIGYDGQSVSQENYRWTSDIMRWVDQGNDVDYLLLEPHVEAVERLRHEARKIETVTGSLRIIGLQKKKPVKPEDKQLIKQWETFHFVAFDNPKQLWVEKNHPAGSTDAEGCAYFPPSAAGNSPLWTLLRHQFEHVVNSYGEPLIVAGREAGSNTPAPELEPA